MMPHNGTQGHVNMKNVLPRFYPESSDPPVMYRVAGIPRGKPFVANTVEQPPQEE